MDIHNYKKRFERQIELLKEDKDILKENKKTSLRFKDYLISEGIGFGKIERYISDIRKFSKILRKPIEKADKTDIRRVMAEIEQTNLSPESKKGFKIMVRKLYRFVREIDEKGVYPEEVKWISINIPKNHKKLPEELLTEEEIKEIIQHCNTLRDKALISTLAESGCRISEIGTMQIKHVSFKEDYGVRITVKGKTGMRKILIINSASYLQQWINQHSENNDLNSYLWYSKKEGFLSYTGIMRIIKQASKSAKIKKRVYAHLFRHSRATQLASQMSEASMKQYFGWGQDSKMCGIYIHMSGEAMDKAILKINGIEIQEEKKDKLLKEKICLRCNTRNGVTNRCCSHCGLILDEEFAKEKVKEDIDRQRADELMNAIIKDPKIMELIKNKLSS